MDISLSLIQIMAFAGLVQCISILVYLFFRAGRLSLAFIPILFFLDLTLALYLDFASALIKANNIDFSALRFWLWMMVCPLSVLFILQFSDLTKPVSVYGYLAVCPLLSAIIILYYAIGEDDIGYTFTAGAIGATLSLPFLWMRQNLLTKIKNSVAGRERYWMILALIFLTLFLISLVYSLLADHINHTQYTHIRTLIGLMFVYLSASYLFRIYPPPIKAITNQASREEFSEEDRKLLGRIQEKLELEKVYLEPSYSRSDMARELEISESILSRVMNQNYNDNFPSILNKLRVDEACQLLVETNAPINVIAEEVGFNSLATFNRVFKDKTNITASHYRQKKVKEASRLIS